MRLQIAERGIAGPEIVEAEPHAQVQDPFQRLRGAGALAHEDALGHFELEPLARASPLSAERRATTATKVGSCSCSRRDVDRDLRGPGQRAASSQAVRSTHSPIGPISRASSASGMNLAGEIEAELGMCPAQQRLEASESPAVGVDHRLVVQDATRCFSSALAQRHFEHAALLGIDMELRARKCGTLPPPASFAR